MGDRHSLVPPPVPLFLEGALSSRSPSLHGNGQNPPEGSDQCLVALPAPRERQVGPGTQAAHEGLPPQDPFWPSVPSAERGRWHPLRSPNLSHRDPQPVEHQRALCWVVPKAVHITGTHFTMCGTLKSQEQVPLVGQGLPRAEDAGRAWGVSDAPTEVAVL